MKKILVWLIMMAILLGSAFAEPAEPLPSYNWYEVFVRSYQDSDGDGIGELGGGVARGLGGRVRSWKNGATSHRTP